MVHSHRARPLSLAAFACSVAVVVVVVAAPPASAASSTPAPAPPAVVIVATTVTRGQVTFSLRNTTKAAVRVSAEGTVAWDTELEARGKDGRWHRVATSSPTCGLSRAAMRPRVVHLRAKRSFIVYIGHLQVRGKPLRGQLRAVFRVETRVRGPRGALRWVMRRAPSRPFVVR